MTIITADEIRQSGTRSIAEVLARVPGLDVLQTGVNVYDIGVRGYQQPFQPRLLVLVDGRQVFIDDYSRTLWDNIPVNIDDIRQIEIVKGAASAMFGSNAAGGVINIVTYSPQYDRSEVATIAGGTQSSYSADGTASVKGSWGGTKFSAGGLREDEFNSARYFSTTAGYPCCDQVPPEKPFHYYVTNSSEFNLSDTDGRGDPLEERRQYR
jgi:iron complex outermembrane receptor protein